MHIESSRNGSDFIDSDHPRWGIVDIYAKTVLNPNESSKASGAILWQWLKQDVPGFKFSNPGIYYIKARYSILVEGENDRIVLESEPIKIKIEEPVGENLEVWNKIKDNGNFAYFIQEGDILIPSYKTKERKKFQQEIEQIINQYPNSFYAESLQQSLEKYQAAEAKRQESLQKIKQKQP